MADSLL
jgi:hypothetical protein